MSSNKSAWNKKYKQGYYKLIHPEKYLGDPDNIKFRSSWEYAFCSYLDNNDRIIKWGCENPVVSYTDLRGKLHRYYVDYIYQIKTNDEMIVDTVLVEIKPKKELYPPEKPKKETNKSLESHQYALNAHITNKLKWCAALEYAEKRGWKFVIITEEHLQKWGIIK